MNILKLCASAISISALALSVSTTAIAATVSLFPTLDGSVRRIFPSGNISAFATGDFIVVSRTFFGTGSIQLVGVLEYDLSGIADGSTINSASLDITLISPVSTNSGSTVIRASAGDNVIDGTDFFGVSSVFSGSVPGGLGGVPGDVRRFEFTSLSPIEDVLISDILQLNISSSRSGILFASLENQDFDAAVLNIDFTAPVSVVPLPAALPLYGTGLAVMGFIGWRRKQRKAAA